MKSVSAQTRRPVPSRETIGRVIGGWPIWLHRAGLGRLAGRRYAVICSGGRRTGHVRRAAVMVLREEPATGELLVVAGTRDAHWYRNVCATPAAEVWLAGRRFHPVQRLLTAREIADLLLAIRRDHPREAPIQAAFLGWPWPGSTEDLGSSAASLGGVSFAPPPRSGARDARSR